MSAQPPYYPQPQGPPPKQQKSSAQVLTCIILAIVAVPVGLMVLGVVAALGIYSVRRYLASAKTAEAKNTVSAISRAAVAAYERESLVGTRSVHKLCGSAIPVPAAGPPPARKYMASTSAGEDYNSGDEGNGWTCLKFTLSYPQYFQYHYHAGSGYLAPTGADFEAGAHGDLDGNGIASTFARTGKIHGETVTLSTELFVDKEYE